MAGLRVAIALLIAAVVALEVGWRFLYASDNPKDYLSYVWMLLFTWPIAVGAVLGGVAVLLIAMRFVWAGLVISAIWASGGAVYAGFHVVSVVVWGATPPDQALVFALSFAGSLGVMALARLAIRRVPQSIPRPYGSAPPPPMPPGWGQGLR